VPDAFGNSNRRAGRRIEHSLAADKARCPFQNNEVLIFAVVDVEWRAKSRFGYHFQDSIEPIRFGRKGPHYKPLA
jgi:hypothetical protein